VNFEGIYPPAITPLTPDGQTDKVAFAELIESLIEAKVHGIVVGGSTGE
jgi:4-hydroxy-tetrahydrodipicolinate synthase